MNEMPLRGAIRAIRWRLRNRFYLSYGMHGTAPINPSFGADFGTPIDRHYIERFLSANSALIKGRVLEVGDRRYTEQFGSEVTSSEVLGIFFEPGVDYVGDLTSCPQIPDASFDCIILTQVLQVIFDLRAAVAEVHRLVRPGGHVLCTFNGISQVNRGAMESYGDRWRLTSQSAQELFETAFGPDSIAVSTYGNALTSVCFLHGIPTERLRQKQLAPQEPDYQLIVAVVAKKNPLPSAADMVGAQDATSH